MDGDGTDLRLAERLKSLRVERGLSLDALAEASGVSRATLSRLENAEVSPTAQVLGKLCGAYGLTMSRLMLMVEAEGAALLRAGEQPVWRDRATGFTRRSISPPAQGFAGEVVMGELKPGARIRYDKEPRAGIEHHFYMLEGALRFTANGQAFDLRAGDSLRVKLHGPTSFAASEHDGAKYLIFVV